MENEISDNCKTFKRLCMSLFFLSFFFNRLVFCFRFSFAVYVYIVCVLCDVLNCIAFQLWYVLCSFIFHFGIIMTLHLALRIAPHYIFRHTYFCFFVSKFLHFVYPFPFFVFFYLIATQSS